MEETMLSSAIESILFASDRPLTVLRIKEVLTNGEEGPTEEEIAARLLIIKERFSEAGHGFELREAQGGFQFTTKRENSAVIQKFLMTKPFKLGRSALEVMAVIAYRQPITRADIDHVRGIDSSHLLRTLMERGLCRMVGKAEIPGRPVLYGTTPKFLEVLGLQSLADLPPLTELDKLQGDTQDPAKILEEGLARFVENTATNREIHAQATEGIIEIEQMLEKATRADNEVYASAEHAETAAANREALEAWQASRPRRRQQQQVVKFEELSLEPMPTLEEAIVEFDAEPATDEPGSNSVN